MREDSKNIESSDLSKEELWSLFLDGDLKAWERLYKFFYQDLYAYGLQLSSQPELTKDCLQELFVVLWERRNHLSEVESSVKAYLLSSLRRSLLKRLKEDRKFIQEDEIEDYTNTIQISPEKEIIRSEKELGKKRIFNEVISVLTKRQKEILFLKYFNGMSYKEIEEILHIEYQSIRNHIYRAKERMREEIEDA